MHIVIAGDGEVGFHLAKILSKENHNITVIDPAEDVMRLIETENNVIALKGDPTSIETLKTAKVHNASLYVSVMREENPNIISCLLAKRLGAETTIARVQKPEYLSFTNQQYFKDLGIDYLVCPEKLAAEEILSLLNETGAIEIVDFSEGQLSLVLIKIPEKSSFASKTIQDINGLQSDLKFRIVAIHRKQNTIIPRANSVVFSGDFVYAVVKKEDIDDFLEHAGIEKITVRNVMIIGGSRIALNIASAIENKMNVKIIEIDKVKGRRLTEKLSDTLIIHGDGRDVALLEQEDVHLMDAFISVTSNSETNILTCLLAKKLGVKRAIALIDNVDFIDIAQNIGVDILVNRKLITASRIAQFTIEGSVTTMKCLYGVDAEVFEFKALSGSKATRKPIGSLGLPEDCIIGGIIRQKEGTIPDDNFQIQTGDHVIVFALPAAYKKVQQYFH